MVKDYYEQLNEAYDDEGRAQLAEQYNPLISVGMSPWVPYVAELPVMSFSDTAPATLLALQVWTIIPEPGVVEATLAPELQVATAIASFSHASTFAASYSRDTALSEGSAVFTVAAGLGFSGKKNASIGVAIWNNVSFLAVDGISAPVLEGPAVFANASALHSLGVKHSAGFGGALCFSDFMAGGVAVHRAPYVGVSFSHAHTLGIGGRKIFSYSQIQEADVATIYQGGRVPVRFVQGESVERNTFFFMPDGVTPVADLSTYEARMDLREYPDDPTALLSMSSEDGSIFLSDTGLIVWEIPGSVTKDFNAITFGGDLFVHAPDGDAIMVCGFDFEMTISHTRGV